MGDKRLNIVDIQNNSSATSIRDKKNQWRQETEAYFEKQWLIDPKQFDPSRNCMERERMERTWELMQAFCCPKDKLIADLACGDGTLTKRLKESGASVHALDIASEAIKILLQKVPTVDKTFKQCLPHTTLEDDAYDIVFADEVIAYLPSTQLRLFMAELCRLVKPNGFVICSTALDLDSQDPLLRFSSLADTEFKVHRWSCAHHRLYLRIRGFFNAPKNYARGYKDLEYRERNLQERRGFSQRWLRWNSQGPLGLFWSGLQYITNPIAHFINQNRTFLLFLEKICRALWGDAGISHAIFIAGRRPLVPLELPTDEIPVEKKGKRQVWE